MWSAPNRHNLERCTASQDQSIKGAHSSGSPAFFRLSRKPGGELIKLGIRPRNQATESLGFNFIASARAPSASGIFSAAA